MGGLSGSDYHMGGVSLVMGGNAAGSAVGPNSNAKQPHVGVSSISSALKDMAPPGTNLLGAGVGMHPHHA